MEFRGARRNERDEVLDLLALWYSDRNFFARYNCNDPLFRDELCLVAVDGGRIVGTLQIFDRRVKIAGQPIAMGGIGSVFTLERMRGHGVGSALVELAVNRMDQEGFDISLLFADRIDFYAKFGWHSTRRFFSVVGGLPSRSARSKRIVVTLFDPRSDLAGVAELHRLYSGRFEPAILRDEPYWRANLVYAGNPDEHFVVARLLDADQSPGCTIIAYARAIRFFGFPMVMEFGYRQGSGEAMAALFDYISIVAAGSCGIEAARGGASILAPPEPTEGSTALLTHSAHDPEIEEELRKAGANISHHEDIFYMWRVVNRGRFARRLNIAPSDALACLERTVSSERSLFWTSDRF